MSINPKILARMKLPHNGQPDLGMTGEPEPALPHDRHLDCAPLTGAWKQRKWAIDLRNVALDLKWPDAVGEKLRNIKDATWWIANRAIVTSMKFKEPSPEQMRGGVPTANTASSGRLQQPGRSTSLATPAAPSARVSDAAEFAASVSRHPKKAEAAILALLSRLYKGPMKETLQGKAMTAVIEAQFEDGRDLDAIKKLLT